ncbi:hypothetical protein ONA91_21150 [Micromonospora sp. DR5-3]|uniref:hypothetical protein n=1 Tax=unclassified Micromonospora TaxID=2617518 RepID=UPI0011D7BFC6|nr:MULTISPECIES: hypothetical protein [unclassified Micromonospora]MCW3816958.1 hypothetical protein [Micromonospora sp. DR5-3]TYC23451.1 hypothetical protein FXF52_15790 [Micromonospora sp. MP36]
MTETSDADDAPGTDDSPGADEKAPGASAPSRTPSTEKTSEDRRRRWLDRTQRVRDTVQTRSKELWKTTIRPRLAELQWREEPRPTVKLVDQRVLPPLLVLSQDQVYGFVIRATFTWSCTTTHPESFDWYIDYFQPKAMERLRRIASGCARDVPPQHARKVETAVQAAFAGDDKLPWPYQHGGEAFECEPEVLVELDERVRRILQPYADRRIAQERERDLEQQRMEQAEELHRRWMRILDDLAARPPTADMPDAVREEYTRYRRESKAKGKAAERRAEELRRKRKGKESSVDQSMLLELFPQQPSASRPHPGPEPQPASDPASEKPSPHGDPASETGRAPGG